MMIDNTIPGACSSWGVPFPSDQPADAAAGTAAPAPAAGAAPDSPDIELPERLPPVT